ncbi:MAG: diguanylate cyclase [Defluviitaleaceae bacterium]|nr:diguanylate cyclase [Defluviitaleaceae bacterium]
MFGDKKEFTILITDDEKMNVNILGDILSPMYNLLISRSGARAIDLANEHKPDLILLDVLMPEMSGFEVIKKLKETDATNKIPVIFITGLTSADDEEKGFFLGAVDYITKPFNKSIVKARVNTHLKIIDQMRTIEHLALVDPLTKISNRRGFENRLFAEWGNANREQKPISILMMDIDKFKTYNDTYGHQQGDTALKAFAEAASRSLNRPSDFAARWGGEEFIILLPNTDSEGAGEVAERVRKNVEETDIPTEHNVITKITVSIGVNSLIPSENTSIDDFIEKADQALYKAKESGRNRYVISGE